MSPTGGDDVLFTAASFTQPSAAYLYHAKGKVPGASSRRELSGINRTKTRSEWMPVLIGEVI